MRSFWKCKKSAKLYSALWDISVILDSCYWRWLFQRNLQLNRVLQMHMKLDVCLRHVIILIQVCTPTNCTWKQLLGKICLSFYMCRHLGEIRRAHHKSTLSSFPICANPSTTCSSAMDPQTEPPLKHRGPAAAAQPRQRAGSPVPLPAALQHPSSGSPMPPSLRLNLCAAPVSATCSTCAQRHREERKHRMCLSGFVKRIYIIFLEVTVNIDRQGKEQVCICAVSYRNISIGILLYSQFPYP